MLLPVMLILLAFRPIHSHPVSGKITDDNGSPVSSARVMVKGTNTATVSLQDGTYNITIINKNATLVFSSVGYTTQEVKIKGRKIIDISLKAAGAELEEVVVIGMALKRKKI